MAKGTKEKIIDAAQKLFYERGYHSTGIDKITAEAEVAKMTLYQHFKSKDELVVAVLRRRDEEFRNRFMREIEQRAKTPRARLLAMFDFFDEWFNSPGFQGCMFINAMAEFKNPAHPVGRAVLEYYRLLEEYVFGLAEQAGAKHPQTLTRQLILLLQGATVMAQSHGSKRSFGGLRQAAETLVDAAIGAGAGPVSQARGAARKKRR